MGTNRILLFIVSLICSINTYSNKNVTSNTVTRTAVYEINNALTGWYTDTWATSVTTVKNEIYSVYVKDDLIPHVCKTDSKGNTTDIELESNYKCDNDGHNEFIIAVDKKGYIHVMGNMHNNTLRYWRSKKAYSITDGFERHFGDIPGEFTYYYFRKSQKDELFMCCRASAKIPWYGEGSRGVGLFKYDCESKKWEACGAIAETCQRPVIYWEPSLSYHMYKSDIRFDKKDRLHFTVLSETKDGEKTMSHAVYAYSDDYGKTWKRADGTKLSLPMNTHNTDIIKCLESKGQATKGAIAEHTSILLDNKNRPAVVYSTNEGTFYSYLDKGKWINETLVPGIRLQRPETLFNKDAMYIIDSFQSDRVWKLNEYGKPAKCINLGINKTRWDHEAWEMGIIRCIYWNKSKWSIYTISGL